MFNTYIYFGIAALGRNSTIDIGTLHRSNAIRAKPRYTHRDWDIVGLSIWGFRDS